MSGMNPFLAELYGTSEVIGAGNSSDTEKLAQAQAMSEMLAGEGIDIDSLSADTIAKVASAVFGDEAALTKAAEEVAEEEKTEEETEEETESDEEKTAQADFLGRMMAHAYVNELSEIEKQAGLKELAGAIKGRAGKGYEATKGFLKGRKEGYKDAPAKFREMITGKAPMGNLEGHTKQVSRLAALKEVGKRVGPEAGIAAAALGAGGYGAYRGLKKKSSALIDTLAQQKVAALLQNDDETKLAGAVDERAVEILRELGYDI